MIREILIEVDDDSDVWEGLVELGAARMAINGALAERIGRGPNRDAGASVSRRLADARENVDEVEAVEEAISHLFVQKFGETSWRVAAEFADT